MKLKIVTGKALEKAFTEVPLRIYRHDPNWIRPLDKDVESVFDPAFNTYFENGEAVRWILTDQTGKPVGRVAAFYNSLLSGKPNHTGGMGFFECINDKNAAFTLFNACSDWLKGKGMVGMTGPVNFGERDRWWGLLTDGFLPPTYCMNYNPPYYQQLFEEYGFKVSYNQYVYQREINTPLHKKYRMKAKRIRENPDYTFLKINTNESTRFAEDFRVVYNAAWQNHENFKPMEHKQALKLLNQFKAILDPELTVIAYYKNQPAGFFIMLPEINQIIKHLNGKLNILGRLKFQFYKWIKTCTRAYGLVFGVHPAYRFRGLEAAMIVKGKQQLENTHYQDLELTWIGDFNPKMIRIIESLGAKKIKTYQTYFYEFEKAP